MLPNVSCQRTLTHDLLPETLHEGCGHIEYVELAIIAGTELLSDLIDALPWIALQFFGNSLTGENKNLAIWSDGRARF